MEVIVLEERIDAIAYDDDWQVSEPEPAVLREAEEEEEQEQELPGIVRPRAAPHHLLLSIQLVTCILLAVAAFALKNIGGEFYRTARAWYYEQLNDTVIFDGSRIAEELLPAATADEA